jgi:pilus assembly protein CpaE
LLSYLKQIYAYVVVDTTPVLNDITLSVLDIADLIVLVVTQDIPSIKNARLFLDLLATLGIQRDKVCFVMNRYDKRIKITPERVAENLKQPVVAVVPLDEAVVIPAVNSGVPFVLDKKNQPSARAVYALAEGVREQLNKLDSVGIGKVKK